MSFAPVAGDVTPVALDVAPVALDVTPIAMSFALDIAPVERRRFAAGLAAPDPRAPGRSGLAVASRPAARPGCGRRAGRTRLRGRV